MPTYIVSTAAGRFGYEIQQRIAQEITRVHSEATGAQGFFAQVIFNDIPAGNHFIGGALLRADQVFVHGHIRAGRTAAQKQALLSNLVASIVAVTSLERRYIWAYLAELPPEQMVEYGHVLPAPGTEQDWLASLPPADRDYMLNRG